MLYEVTAKPRYKAVMQYADNDFTYKNVGQLQRWTIFV